MSKPFPKRKRNNNDDSDILDKVEIFIGSLESKYKCFIDYNIESIEYTNKN